MTVISLLLWIVIIWHATLVGVTTHRLRTAVMGGSNVLKHWYLGQVWNKTPEMKATRRPWTLGCPCPMLKSITPAITTKQLAKDNLNFCSHLSKCRISQRQNHERQIHTELRLPKEHCIDNGYLLSKEIAEENMYQVRSGTNHTKKKKAEKKIIFPPSDLSPL